MNKLARTHLFRNSTYLVWTNFRSRRQSPATALSILLSTGDCGTGNRRAWKQTQIRVANDRMVAPDDWRRIEMISPFSHTFRFAPKLKQIIQWPMIITLAKERNQNLWTTLILQRLASEQNEKRWDWIPVKRSCIFDVFGFENDVTSTQSPKHPLKWSQAKKNPLYYELKHLANICVVGFIWCVAVVH